MKAWTGVCLRTLGIATVLAVVFLGTVRVIATNDSLWANNGTITKTLVAENITSDNSPYFNRACDKIPQKVNQYHWTGAMYVKNGYIDLANNCWTKTTYGLFGTGNDGEYVRLGDVGGVALLKTNSMYNKIALPNSDRMVVTYSNGTSSTRDWYVYDRVSSSLKYAISGDGYGRTVDTYSFLDNASYWTLKVPGTNQNMGVSQSAYSNSGKWAAIVGNAQGYMKVFRLNLETRELLPISLPFPNGYSGNPSYNLAISNDGRYIATSIDDNKTSQFVVYDLSTCMPVPGQPLAIATGCTKRDVRSVALPDVASNIEQRDVEFSDSGESISYSYYVGNRMNRYMITSPGKDVHLLEYLALGDSFSSGEGDNDGGRYYVAGTDGNGEAINNTGIANFPYWKEKCHLGTRSYPYLLAAEAGLTSSQFRSVACSGSSLNDILNISSAGSNRYLGRFDQFAISQDSDELREAKAAALNDFIPGRASQIEFVQKYKPRVATISIGGNDIDFARKLAECVPPASTCRFATTDRATTGVEISLLYDKLVDAYSKLKAASPTTRFYVIGYPQIASGGGECSKNVLLNADEREYATYTVDYLDRTIVAAAAKAGLSYLDIENSLVGKNLCSTADKNTLAVNGLETGSDRTLLGDSHYFGYLANESYHPNNIGHVMMASALRADMGYAAITTYNPCFPGLGLNCSFANSSRPSPLAYFGMPANFTPIAHSNVQANDDVQRGADIIVDVPTGNTFKPGSVVNFTLHSTPIGLGQGTVTPEGTIFANLSIPAGTEPGYHTLHLTGTTQGNDSVDYYQDVFVYASDDDLDGDGVANEDDICGFVEASNIDEDSDGVDDACDGYVGQVEQHPLYRVRQGDEAKGEIANRLYVERDVLEAKSKLSIVNDDDPDSDGWAVVGHTEGNYGGATQTQFWIDDQSMPHLLLNGGSMETCAQLTPVSLAVVMVNEDRLLKAENPNGCPQPEPAMNRDSDPISTQETASAQIQGAGLTTVTQFANTMPGAAELAMRPDMGHVAGISTAIASSFDGSGKKSAEVANMVGSSVPISASIILAILLAIVLFVKSLALFTR